MPKPRSIWNPSISWPSRASGSPSCRPIRRIGRDAPGSAGETSAAEASIPPEPTCVLYPRAGRSIYSSTTVPSLRRVAFEELLAQGEKLGNRLVGAFSDSRDWPQLVHIATDGETYGHHHRFGDMALAYALQYIEEKGLATLTNYGEYLEKHPPDHAVEILESELLELRARRRTVEKRLRLSYRRPSALESGLAGAAAGSPRLAARRDCPQLRGAMPAGPAGSLGRPQRLHPRCSRSIPRKRGRLLRQDMPFVS